MVIELDRSSFELSMTPKVNVILIKHVWVFFVCSMCVHVGCVCICVFCGHVLIDLGNLIDMGKS